MSLATVLLPGPSCLRLTHISTTDIGISLELCATRGGVACPSCSVESAHIHSFYQRTVADLPWAGVPVTLQLHVRRFVCRHPACPRRTFSEPLPEVVAPSARRSIRLANELRPWLSAAQASDLRELKSLAEGMERDYAAVEAALRLPYSTGPVEGNQVGSS